MTRKIRGEQWVTWKSEKVREKESTRCLGHPNTWLERDRGKSNGESSTTSVARTAPRFVYERIQRQGKGSENFKQTKMGQTTNPLYDFLVRPYHLPTLVGSLFSSRFGMVLRIRAPARQELQIPKVSLCTSSRMLRATPFYIKCQLIAAYVAYSCSNRSIYGAFSFCYGTSSSNKYSSTPMFL